MRNLPFFLTLSRESQRSTLEALVFAADEPLTNKTLFKVLILEDGLYSETSQDQPDAPQQPELSDAPETADNEPTEGDAASDGDTAPTDASSKKGSRKRYPIEPAELATLTTELVEEINNELVATERPYRIVRIAGGYQFATTSEFGEVVARLVKSRTRRRLSQAALEALAIIAYKQPIGKPEIEAIRGINSNEVINSLVEKNLVTIAGRSDAPGKPLLYGTTDDFLRMFGLHSTKDLPKLRELDELFQHKAAELAGGLDISVKTTSGELLTKIQAMVDNEQKIHEHERLREEGRHEDELSLLDAATIAEMRTVDDLPDHDVSAIADDVEQSVTDDVNDNDNGNVNDNQTDRRDDVEEGGDEVGDEVGDEGDEETEDSAA